jgi:hypothetical protein
MDQEDWEKAFNSDEDNQFQKQSQIPLQNQDALDDQTYLGFHRVIMTILVVSIERSYGPASLALTLPAPNMPETAHLLGLETDYRRPATVLVSALICVAFRESSYLLLVPY